VTFHCFSGVFCGFSFLFLAWSGRYSVLLNDKAVKSRQGYDEYGIESLYNKEHRLQRALQQYGSFRNLHCLSECLMMICPRLISPNSSVFAPLKANTRGIMHAKANLKNDNPQCGRYRRPEMHSYHHAIFPFCFFLSFVQLRVHACINSRYSYTLPEM